MASAHRGCAIGHSPAIDVEHGEHMQQDVAVIYAKVPSKGHGIERAIAMGEFNAFWSCRCARGVIDRARVILVDVDLNAWAIAQGGKKCRIVDTI